MHSQIARKRKAAATRKPRAKAKTKAKAISLVTWGWLLTGILTGVFLCLLFMKLYNTKLLQNDASIKSSKPTTNLSKKTGKANKSNKHVEPRFDFYTLLPKTESNPQQSSKKTNVASKPKSNQPSPPPQKNKVLDLKTADTTTEYSIQAGSFRDLHDADELKAKLTLNGFNSHIEKVKIGNNQEWHRVFVGPMDSEKAALLQQELLQTLKINGTLVQKRG
jgi:cell division protein FtsN